MSADSPTPVVTVYWRPGCPFCSRLFRGLDESAIDYESVDIWEHPEAAEFVRSVARGNETVPTVAVRCGEETISMVNPPAADVAQAIARLSVSA
ncbi:MAG: glutaredoxin domain-containing protein [Ilumatobacteraceae bacterium]